MDPTPSPEEAPRPPVPEGADLGRECWEASQALLAVRPGGFAAARLRLHLAGLAAALRALPPEAAAAARAALSPALLGALEAGHGGEDLLGEAEGAHQRVLAAVEAERTLARRRQERRLLLAGAGALAAGLLALGAVRALSWWRAPPDLARGQPWSASSSAGTCEPERGQCAGEQTRVRFYTREEPGPWYRVDLGQPRTFSRVTVRNRGDALLERAIPLVLEVSDDGATWREVARRGDAFAVWEARFPPATARYLRARVDRTSVLHLEGVEVHP